VPQFQWLMNEGGQERTTANDDMAGAGGLEPPNGGIKNRTAALISLRIFPNCRFKRLYRIKGLRANFQLLGARDDGCATHHKSPRRKRKPKPSLGRWWGRAERRPAVGSLPSIGCPVQGRRPPPPSFRHAVHQDSGVWDDSRLDTFLAA